MHRWNDAFDHFACAVVRGEETSLAAQIVCPRYSAATAIALYRNNHRGNLLNALAGAYPVIGQLVGERFFRMMGRRYIDQHPSRSGNLHRYGGELAAFLATFAPVQSLPYLRDMAVLEWACHCAYFAPDVGALDLTELARVEPDLYPTLKLSIHPAAAAVRSSFPVCAIWQAHQPESAGEFCIDLGEGPCIALVSRCGGVVQVSEMSEGEFVWLENLRAGNTLGTATDRAQERYPQFDLRTTLVDLVSRNVLAAFSVGAAS